MISEAHLAALLGGYLLGSIPFGLLLTRMAGLGDIRAIGSGNIGATNVLRTGNRWIALLTLLLDAGKGAIPALAAMPYGPDIAAVAGGSAFLGHLFPVWLKFRGGKGVATFLGVTLAVSWPAGLATGLTWLLVAALFRFSSLAALAAAALAPFYVFLAEGAGWLMGLAVVVGALIYIRHWDNMQRLMAGTEPGIGTGDSQAGD